ncbi:hypothetical protein N7466_001069 [Penicillium verhagenii]|uniref:uncharacterized protein n=1 Tax=Penicillium verhagenii TaxID=1562060 RepID=UPI0025455153|nr:uncharacterized protein N7466_001069 [Penicillium verhagenii]KAJ5948054.1 hypothetical protein N7466_001069 [Penicillium verhagenii]
MPQANSTCPLKKESIARNSLQPNKDSLYSEKEETQRDIDYDVAQNQFSDSINKNERAPHRPDGDPDLYPEGGWSSWSVVIGSWMASFSTIGMMNSLGIFQTYLEAHQLRDYSSGKIGWILGVYSFLAFFCGIQVGPIFDAKGPRILVTCGGIGTILTMVLLGFCTKYWHFMLVFGVLGGVSVSLAFNPAISIVAHYFRRRRGFATGIASSGASCGGVVFPLLFQSVASQVGFAWATRVIALVDLIAFGVAIILIRSRLPPKETGVRALFPDLSLFCNGTLMLASMGIFFMEWGLFVPLTYLTSYALSHGQSSQFSFLLLSLVNAGSVFGRWIPGYCADRIGRFNTLIITILGCLLCITCLWVSAGTSQAVITIFALLFGFASGSNVSLAPVCIGQLCKLEEYGRYYATAYVIVSISTLTGIPIAGQILTACGGEYQGLIAFAAASYTASLICLVITKLFCCGWNRPWATF